uniref:Uncharacterized protein n=1 Tax=viral metagenome TaxID=1070528 RepID=A0A6C0IBX7_9ZZZZ
MDIYMLIFDVLVFSATIVVLYLWWNSTLDIALDSVPPVVKEGFTTANGTVNNISMCPLSSKSYIDKTGDTLCCDGNVNGIECEGKTICTMSSLNSKDYEACSTYLASYYARKGKELCPSHLSSYYENKGVSFCTNGSLAPTMDAPMSHTQRKCKVAGGYTDATSCEIELELEKFVCPSPQCQKTALPGNPVLLSASFKDLMGIYHSCYEDKSIFRYLAAIFGPDWKAKSSWLNPDRNVIFCSIAKKYFIDKTLQKNQIDI